MSIEEFFLYLANTNFTHEYIFIFFILSLIGFSLPVPYTLIIIANIYIFGWIGFGIVVFSIPIGALITFFYIKKFSNFLKKITFINKIYKKKLSQNIKFHNNIYVLILVRATIPFFLVSVGFALTNMSIKKYLYATIIGTFSHILLISLIITSIRESIVTYNDIVIRWNDPRFIVSFILLLSFVFISKKINIKLFDDKNNTS